MVLQACRKAVSNGKFGAVACLHFDPRTGRRCNKYAGELVFCSLPNHACDWDDLSEAEQVTFNELLTSPTLAHDAARWTEVFEEYRAAKAAENEARKTAVMANAVATRYERVAAANTSAQKSIEQASARIAGMLSCVIGFGCQPDFVRLATASVGTPFRLEDKMSTLLLRDRAETPSGAC